MKKAFLEQGNLSTRVVLVRIRINRQEVSAPDGSNLAAILIEHGYFCLRPSEKTNSPRSVFCGMGVCFECLVKVGEEELRACQTLVEEGMEITVPWSQDA